MPFETTRNVPREVKEMPAGVKKIWSAAFKKAMAEKPEDAAHSYAMSIVGKHFTQQQGKWVKAKGGGGKGGLEGLGGGLEDPDADPLDPEADPGEEGDLEAGGLGEEGDLEGDPVEGEGEEPPAKTAKGRKKKKKTEEVDPDLVSVARALSAASTIRGAVATDSVGVEMTELMTLDAKGFKLTEDGFLVAEPRIARTGIQLYKGSEVGRPDMDVVRVYRPETQVFDRRALKSLAHRPITLEHPEVRVDASNWKELAVGKSDGDVVRDGEFIRVPLMLMDAHAIAAAQSGKSQLSVGYGAKLLWGAGQAPDGQLFDAMQTEIRANHIALVSAARGGNKLRIGDACQECGGGPHDCDCDGHEDDDHQDAHPQRRTAMTERLLDGVTIELEDRDAQVLDRHISSLKDKLRDQGTEVDALKAQLAQCQSQLATATGAGAAKDGEIVALKAKVADSALSPEKLDKALNLRMDVVDRATTYFGDAQKYAWVGKSDAQIRRDVVAARLGDAKAKAMDDTMVEGAFLSITEPETQDGFRQMTQSFSRPPTGGFNDRAATAYDKRNEELANRFKKNRKPFGGNAAAAR